ICSSRDRLFGFATVEIARDRRRLHRTRSRAPFADAPPQRQLLAFGVRGTRGHLVEKTLRALTCGSRQFPNLAFHRERAPPIASIFIVATPTTPILRSRHTLVAS